MRIYGFSGSGNCLKVKFTADLLGVDYTWVEVDSTAGETRTPDYLGINPFGQVPAVRLDDGRTLAQSNAIMAYLAHGSHLLPDDGFDRAWVDAWMYWEQYSHEPYIAVCRSQMLYQGLSKDQREAWRVERGEAALDIMDNHLTDRRWFVTDAMTIADIALYAYTHVAHEGGFDLSARPHVARWIADCRAALTSH